MWGLGRKSKKLWRIPCMHRGHIYIIYIPKEGRPFSILPHHLTTGRNGIMFKWSTIVLFGSLHFTHANVLKREHWKSDAI